jgi:hypothetical protein
MSKKSNKKLDGWNHHMEDKREGQRKVKKMHNPGGTKEGRELVPLMVGNYLTHNPSNATCMHISYKDYSRFTFYIFRQNFALLCLHCYCIA